MPSSILCMHLMKLEGSQEVPVSGLAFCMFIFILLFIKPSSGLNPSCLKSLFLSMDLSGLWITRTVRMLVLHTNFTSEAANFVEWILIYWFKEIQIRKYIGKISLEHSLPLKFDLCLFWEPYLMLFSTKPKASGKCVIIFLLISVY